MVVCDLYCACDVELGYIMRTSTSSDGTSATASSLSALIVPRKDRKRGLINDCGHCANLHLRGQETRGMSTQVQQPVFKRQLYQTALYWTGL